jgi:hypothetical protein
VEQKTSFDKNVMPEAQKSADDTAVTDFEKQGQSRHMMQ